MPRTLKASLSIALWLLLAGCADPRMPAFEYMSWMMDAPSVKPQEAPMRTPVEGTIPRGGWRPYPFGIDEGEAAGVALTNPLPRTKEVFLQGEQAYNATCIVCHGPTGMGDGSVVPKFPRPPSLLSEKMRGWSDGRIYHVIMKGQNLMSSYASQLTPDQRWAIVHYVRALQRADQPTPQDVQRLKDQLAKIRGQ